MHQISFILQLTGTIIESYNYSKFREPMSVRRPDPNDLSTQSLALRISEHCTRGGGMY